MANKKYYWLKLKDNFFTDKRIKKLRKIAGGDTYTIIYLKMQLLSLQDDGNLYFENIENTFEEEIALQIDEDIEDVKITIAYLIRSKLLIQIKENMFELVETKNCIGSETRNAESMRKLRESRKEGLTLLHSVTKSYTEKEKEKEKEIEIEIEKKDKTKKTSKIKRVKPTLEEIQDYIKQKDLKVDGKQFYDYFETGNWVDSKGNKVKNWKQKLLTWNSYKKNLTDNKTSNYEQRKYNNLNDLYSNGG